MPYTYIFDDKDHILTQREQAWTNISGFATPAHLVFRSYDLTEPDDSPTNRRYKYGHSLKNVSGVYITENVQCARAFYLCKSLNDTTIVHLVHPSLFCSPIKDDVENFCDDIGVIYDGRCKDMIYESKTDEYLSQRLPYYQIGERVLRHRIFIEEGDELSITRYAHRYMCLQVERIIKALSSVYSSSNTIWALFSGRIYTGDMTNAVYAKVYERATFGFLDVPKYTRMYSERPWTADEMRTNENKCMKIMCEDNVMIYTKNNDELNSLLSDMYASHDIAEFWERVCDELSPDMIDELDTSNPNMIYLENALLDKIGSLPGVEEAFRSIFLKGIPISDVFA